MNENVRDSGLVHPRLSYDGFPLCYERGGRRSGSRVSCGRRSKAGTG